MKFSKELLIELLNTKGEVYLASPWFDEEQFERCEWVRDNLRKLGYKVFSPKDANLVSPDADKDWRTQAFEGNVNAIKSASFVLAITNGKDMGTIFESGVAYSEGIPVVYFAEGLEGQFNLMLAQSGVHVLTNREQLLKDLASTQVLESIITGNVYKDYEGEIE